MEKITEGLIDFKRFEKIVFEVMCKTGRELIGEYLKRFDGQILAMRDTKEYRFVRFGTTAIKTLFGEVSYTRRCYKGRSSGYTFLLDEAMGIGSGYGLVSENLAEQIIIECLDKSFRKAAKSISSLTGQSISGVGAWGVLQQFGEKLDIQEKRLKELDQEGATGHLGNLSGSVLFEELDDVWIQMQKERRRKKGGSAAAAGKKTGKKPMHAGTAYTGWEQTRDGKFRTMDKFAYAGFGTANEFTTTFEMLLRQRYDMDGVERRVVNGDGAEWIRTAAEENDSILQLDPFHRSRAVLRAVSDKKDQGALFNAIGEKDVDKALAVIDGLIANAADESAMKKLQELYSYFCNNKDTLLTWQERGIELPKPPPGVVYRNLGVQESSNCDLITQRMKHRKGSWTINGGANMARALCFRNTIGLDTVLGMLPEPTGAGLPADVLSSAKAPVCDGKGYDGAWLHADMPFDQAFKTQGREAIRGMLRKRRLADWALL